VLRIRPDQLEALRGSVRACFPEAVLAALRARGLRAERDAAGVVATDARGLETRLAFHPDGLPASLELPSGASYRLEHDAFGRLGAIEHRARAGEPGARVTLDRDEAGRIVRAAQIGAGAYGFGYDGRGRLSEVAHPDGSRQRLSYDEAGRLVASTDRMGHTTRFERDAGGEVAAIVDPLGRATRFEMADGGLAAVVYPDGSSERFGFDEVHAAGVVTRRDGSEVVHELDERDRLRRLLWPDGRYVAFDFDEEDNLASCRNDDESIAWTFDAGGEPSSERSSAGVTRLRHDAEGRLTELATPFGDTVQYGWDREGRLERIVDWEGRALEIVYAPDGTVAEQRWPGGVLEEHRYGPTGRLAQTRLSRGATVLSEQRYGYDACGRLVSLTDAGGTRSFGYDAEGRLLSERDERGGAVDWAYDAKGNMTRSGGRAVEIGLSDEPLRVGGDPIRWNALGQAVALPGASGGALLLRYHGDGTLAAVDVDGRSWRYRYDGLGRRILKTDGIRSWRYGWCGHQLLWEEYAEAPGARPVRRDYLWAPHGVAPVAFREGGRTYHLQLDARGAVIRAFRATDGEVVWSARYDSFGRAEIELAFVRQPFRLLGQYYDDESGLHYSLARTYCPWLATYLSRDPSWHEPEATGYSYCRNDPWNRADPFGALGPLLAVVGAIAVGAVVGAVVGGITGGWKGAASGAVSGAATVGGAILGGLLGGPPGAVAGAMAGNVLGTFGGELAGQALTGEPICFECAAKEAAVAGLIDVALLGLGKIPGVKQAVRAVGQKLFKMGAPLRKWAKKSLAKVRVQTEGRLKLPGQYKKAAVAKEEIDATADKIAGEIPGAKVAKAPLKGQKRVMEKAADDYGGDVTQVTDIARNTIVVPAGQEEKALARLRELNPDIPDKGVKIVSPSKDPLGYSGMNVKQPTKSGTIAETQINSPEMIYAKEKPADARRILGDETYDAIAAKPGMPPGGKGHKFYEDYRVLSPDDPQRDVIAAQSREYYDSVRRAGGGGG
jgi:RHS repeat-associated protein